MISLKWKIASVAILVAIHWRNSFAEDSGEDLDTSLDLKIDEERLKALTPEEEALANEARAHIAKTIENNLVRLMTVIAVRGNRRPRQDDDDDETAATPNPNVLPQVAQILGAIFTGSLNITRVVDQTFGLVPNIVRNQVGGLVKLLTGENMEEGSSTVATASAKPDPSTTYQPSTTVTAKPSKEETTAVTTEESATKGKPRDPLSESSISAIQQNNNATKGKYRVRSRTKATSTTTKKTLLEDDEIEKYEDEVIRMAKAYEPYVKNREPRGFIDTFRNIFGRVDFNMTDIQSAVPTIFQGTRTAFQVLDTLGVIDASDLFEDLGLPPLYGAGEEEEEE